MRRNIRNLTIFLIVLVLIGCAQPSHDLYPRPELQEPPQLVTRADLEALFYRVPIRFITDWRYVSLAPEFASRKALDAFYVWLWQYEIRHNKLGFDCENFAYGYKFYLDVLFRRFRPVRVDAFAVGIGIQRVNVRESHAINVIVVREDGDLKIYYLDPQDRAFPVRRYASLEDADLWAVWF